LNSGWRKQKAHKMRAGAMDRPFCFYSPAHFHWNQLIINAEAGRGDFTSRTHDDDDYDQYCRSRSHQWTVFCLCSCHRPSSWWLPNKNIKYTIVLNESFCCHEAGRDQTDELKKKTVSLQLSGNTDPEKRIY